MKYIIFDTGQSVIFPPTIQHDEMVTKGRKPKTAGQCMLFAEGSNVTVSCFGGSTTLGIESSPKEDAEIISEMINSFV
jgi:hypothetical protein